MLVLTRPERTSILNPLYVYERQKSVGRRRLAAKSASGWFVDECPWAHGLRVPAHCVLGVQLRG